MAGRCCHTDPVLGQDLATTNGPSVSSIKGPESKPIAHRRETESGEL
jgi:hypothetical protein